jgi:hypothetical protein
VVGAVVEMVRVAVLAEAPVISTGLVEPKLKVGGYSAPAGLEVSAAVSVTLPVKPPAGVRVIVEVFSDAAPGAIESAVPVTTKEGTTEAATEIELLVAPVNPVDAAVNV